jgi:hypothetical protein
MLWPIRFHCVGVWTPAAPPSIHTHIRHSGTQPKRKSGNGCTQEVPSSISTVETNVENKIAIRWWPVTSVLTTNHTQELKQRTPCTVVTKHWTELCNTALIHVRFLRVHKIAKSDYQHRHVCPPAWNSTPTQWVFMKFYIRTLFENVSRKFRFH